ncbi:HAD family hydrolase [Candidatus Falkowbacteria bacterium]|nr:HAD family hydrolase [Candidatus Falkowbacteria bacterium]
MIIIFDLDYTLLDMERLHDKLADIFNKEDFRADYKKYFKDAGVNFDLDKYFGILRDEGRVDDLREKNLKLEVEKLISRIDDYLKVDAENVLKYFKGLGDKLILITFGNKKWQEEKVKNLSIKKYFDEIIFEEKDKGRGEYLKSLGGGGEEILIVNDNFKEIEEMKKILGEKAKALMVEGKYNKGARPHIKDLQELIPEEKRQENIINLR